jgi:hypothetical protein
MSEYVDQVWQWMYEPLQRLKEDARVDPEVPWEQRLQRFLDELGVSSSDAHPLVYLFVQQVEQYVSGEERTAFLADDGLDAVVYEIVRQATPEPESADLPEEIAPDQLADLVVRQIALPVLVELSTSRPDLVDAIPELSRTLGWVLAERLCAA